jgi:hypothetical protein
MSGWHVHPGVHSVVVLSGTLTVYDDHCVRTDDRPGEIYLGGDKATRCPQRGDGRPQRRHYPHRQLHEALSRYACVRSDGVRCQMMAANVRS